MLTEKFRSPLAVLVAIMLISFIHVSCSSNIKESEDIQGFAFKEEGDANWSFISPDGKVIIDKKVALKPITPIRDGHFYAQNEKGFYELYKVDGDNCYRVGDQYKSITEFYDGVAIVCSKYGTPSLIDGNGKEIKNLGEIDGKIVTGVSKFNYGYATYETKDGEHGVIDTKGEAAPIKKNGDGISVIEYKGDICFMSVDEKRITYYDKQGKVIHSIIKNDDREYLLGLMKNGYMGFVELGSTWEEQGGIVDYDGNIIVEGAIDIQSIRATGKTCFIYKSKTDKFGVKDYKGADILKAEYDDIAFFDESGTAFVAKKHGSDYKLFDLTGQQIGKEEFTLDEGLTNDSYYLKRIDASHIIVYANDKYNIVSIQGEMLHDAPSIQEIADVNPIIGWVPNDKLVDDTDILDVLGVSSFYGDIEGFSPYIATDLVVERLKNEGYAVKKEPKEFGGFEISYFREWQGYKAEYTLYVPHEDFSIECVQCIKIYLVDDLEKKQDKIYHACCDYVKSLEEAVVKDEEPNEMSVEIEDITAKKQVFVKMEDDVLFYFYTEQARAGE